MNINNCIDIIYNNNNIKILQYISESNKQFKKRLKFIKSIEKKNLYHKNIELISLYWYCITYLKCKYDLNIMEFIQNLN